MADECFDLTDDALVQVLLLLPTSSRRRFRLVCKRWRDLIDERTPERQARTKILAYFAERMAGRAFVFDDRDGSRRRAWRFPSYDERRYDMIGTCNGLLCLHGRSASSSAINAGRSSVIVVTNPITGEAQLLPPVPAAERQWEKFGRYSFGYHPTTGEYKVVYIPCQRRQAVDVVWVFTLGGGTGWRAVPVLVPGASYCHCGEVVSVDGATYWLNAASDRVMALDLRDERVMWLDLPPPSVRAGLTPEEGGWRLTSVHARLGVAATTSSTGVEVWVLEGRPRRWARGRTLLEPRGHQGCWITAPHLTYGEYAISRSWGRTRLYRHKVGSLIGDDGRLLELPEGAAELVMDDGTPYYGNLKTFAYVETLEPLPAIDGAAGGDGGSDDQMINHLQQMAAGRRT
ncbi:unnamed protein product [Urochloa decumbens]|uniref:F-box domain-containing protein n=1 Tax=Urochloa decumbens TaxID=240449 RepID=A0ABC9BPT8_9POAL